MRILLDENVPYPVRRLLRSFGHHVDHVKDKGLQGTKNGALMAEADKNYDLLVTNDKDFQLHKVLQPTATLGVLLLRLGTTAVEEELSAITHLFGKGRGATYIGKLTLYP